MSGAIDPVVKLAHSWRYCGRRRAVARFVSLVCARRHLGDNDIGISAVALEGAQHGERVHGVQSVVVHLNGFAPRQPKRRRMPSIASAYSREVAPYA